MTAIRPTSTNSVSRAAAGMPALPISSRDDRAWRLLAIRSRNRIEWSKLTKACADADIVVAERWLPRGCTPRWLKLDRQALEQTGGVAIYLTGQPRVETVRHVSRSIPGGVGQAPSIR